MVYTEILKTATMPANFRHDHDLSTLTNHKASARNTGQTPGTAPQFKATTGMPDNPRFPDKDTFRKVMGRGNPTGSRKNSRQDTREVDRDFIERTSKRQRWFKEECENALQKHSSLSENPHHVELHPDFLADSAATVRRQLKIHDIQREQLHSTVSTPALYHDSLTIDLNRQRHNAATLRQQAALANQLAIQANVPKDIEDYAQSLAQNHRIALGQQDPQHESEHVVLRKQQEEKPSSVHKRRESRQHGQYSSPLPSPPPRHGHPPEPVRRVVDRKPKGRRRSARTLDQINTGKIHILPNIRTKIRYTISEDDTRLEARQQKLFLVLERPSVSTFVHPKDWRT
jgi:hypothetical protein